MVDVKRAVATALVLSLGLGAAPVRAFPVIDAANLVQNFMAAYQSLQQVTTLYSQLQTQWQQLRTMQQQLKTMDPSQIAGIVGDITGIEELHQIERALAAHRDLLGSIKKVKDGFDERLDTAKLMKLTWKEYVAWEQNRLARREEGAMARVNAEIHAMKRIESDYEFAREQASKIAGTSGTHEAVQQMNVQMNRVIQQNAELMRQLSTAFGRATAEREMQEAEDKARAKAQEDAYRAVAEAARVADRAAIEKWSAGRR
jgi:P-type conjugative transfer protein TrbJ